jgi:hypothetical protein
MIFSEPSSAALRGAVTVPAHATRPLPSPSSTESESEGKKLDYQILANPKTQDGSREWTIQRSNHL